MASLAEIVTTSIPDRIVPHHTCQHCYQVGTLCELNINGRTSVACLSCNPQGLLAHCTRCNDKRFHYLWGTGGECQPFCSECYLIAAFRRTKNYPQGQWHVLQHANLECFWALPTGDQNHSQIKHSGPHRKVLLGSEIFWQPLEYRC